MGKIQIFNDDFLNGIKDIPEQSIDLILTDIPYNISKKDNLKTLKNRTGRNGIDFGEWDKEFNELDLIHLIPLLKKGGSFLIWTSFEQYYILKEDVLKDDLIFKDKIIWEKTNPMPRNRDRRYISNIELCSWFIKKGKWTFNRQNEKYEGSVLRYPSESGGGYKRYHPTQKNLKMIKYLLNIHSNKGDTILDPFLGGGTTAVASRDLERNFIGFEIDKNYYDISIKRTEEK